MAKTVKFNMRFGDVSIRTVEDLQENFSMDDVMVHYENGLLKKFLERRGYSDYAEKVDELSKKNLSIDSTARELISIFDIDIDKDAVDEFAEILRLRRENQESFNAYEQGKTKYQEVIKKYFSDYNLVVESLIENKDELGKIKAGVKELLDSYMHILVKDWRALYFRLESSRALYPICHMLTKDFFRHLWLVENGESTSADTTNIYVHLVEAIKNELSESKDDHAWVRKSNKAFPSNDWEGIVTTGKTYMILSVPREARVRPPGDYDNERFDKDVNDKFLTLNGIEYRHNSNRVYLYYTEV